MRWKDHLALWAIMFALPARPAYALWGFSADFGGTGECSVSFSFPNSPAGRTQQECEANRAIVAPLCAQLDAYFESYTDSNGGVHTCDGYCRLSPCTGTDFVGGGSGGVPIEVPGAEFLPPGNLLRDSPYEHLAGGLNSFGDVSQMSTGYGDAFFTRHYTRSTNDWINDANERFQRYLETNRQHRERFGAGETPAQLAKAVPVFGQGLGPPPSTTMHFENVYADDAARENFLTRLQLGKTGPGPGGGRYETLEEMARRRMHEKTGGSMIMDGVPIQLREPEITVPKETTMADQIKAGRKDAMGFFMDNLDETKYPGMKDKLNAVNERVDKADGILTPFVTDMAQIVTDGISGAVEVIVKGSPGEIGAYADQFAAKVENRAGQAVDEARGFVKDEFIDNVSGALGELVEVGLSNEMVKATWDTGKKAVEDIAKYTKAGQDKINEVMANGGDLNAVRQVVNKELEKFAAGAAGQAKDATVDWAASNAADTIKNTFWKTSDHHDTGGDPKVHPDARGERGELHRPRR
jgi:hypothetical protein